MAKSYNQKAKILLIERMLHNSGEDHVVSMKSILDELEKHGIRAERKSIYDDMDALRSVGMDIRFRRGRPGGYYVVSEGAEDTSPKKSETSVKSAVSYALELKVNTEKETQKRMKLLCDVEKLSEAEDFFGTSAEYNPKTPDCISIVTNNNTDEVFFAWLTLMGKSVRIQKPKKTAIAYREYLKGLAKEYKNF